MARAMGPTLTGEQNCGRGGAGGRKRVAGDANLLCSFLFRNNIDLKNNTRNCRKSFLKFQGAQIAAINLFQFDLDKL